MDNITKNLVVNKFLLIAIIYFFFNSFLLPSGLLYTTLLTPFFYFYLLKNRCKNVLFTFFICLLPYFLVHTFIGTNLFYYAKSTVLVFTAYVFAYAFYAYLKKNELEVVFPTILKINFVFFVLALLFFATDYKEFFWTVKDLTVNIKNFRRLQLLTYEPSYYSLLFAPIAIYYFLKFLLLPTSWKTAGTYILLIALPLLFSFSLGVLSGLILCFLMLFIFYFFRLVKFKKITYILILSGILVITSSIILVLFFPENPLFERASDIVNGKDTSASGRTIYALSLALDIAERKSVLFGTGLGQIKVIGTEIIREFYHYNKTELASIRIPNAIAETIAMFGISGLILRLGLQLFLFYKTKVYSNYYRFAVFTFVFIYQFSGSFFHNPAEMVLWVIAFSPGFKLFNVAGLRPN